MKCSICFLFTTSKCISDLENLNMARVGNTVSTLE